MVIEPGDTVTFEYTGRLDDGTVFDTSQEAVAAEAGLTDEQSDREFTPLTVDVGEGELIEGLDQALVGLDAQDAETVTIPPEKAYGEWTEEHVQEFDLMDFKKRVGGQQPEEGAHIRTQNGGLAEIVHVDDETVRVDFNHELCDETLEFDVEIVDVE